jgi:hypothetical protein
MSLAPITLHTGLPGAGKTLNTLSIVERIGREEGVTVYYNGIPDLKVPGWVELPDATLWHTLPQNSILVIDEAQRVFRPRHTGSLVPEHVSKLETIRHQGIRLVVITQHPKLLDSNLRRLTGKHRHYVRVFGSKLVSCHEWEECKPDPDTNRTDSIKTTVAHPKHVYGWYKSAEVHTIKTRIPKRLIAVLGIPLVVLGCGWFAFQNLGRFKDPDRITQGAGIAKGEGVVAPTRSSGPKPRAEWIGAFQPRVPGYAWTAPAYDSLTEPKQAPFPAGCVAGKSACHCYTEQGTRLDVEPDDCARIVERGQFQFWREPGQLNGPIASQPDPAVRQRVTAKAVNPEAVVSPPSVKTPEAKAGAV